MRTRSAAARSGSATSPISARSGPQLDRICAHHDALRAGFGKKGIDRARLERDLGGIADFVLQFARPVWMTLNEAQPRGRRILFEGAQGVLLDVDHGTYPFVTSSNTVAGTAAGGTGLGPSAAGFVLGIVKAYTTRVGSGPFPTELDDEIGQRLGERGREFGTVTGRKRRCGWFDAVLVRQSMAVAGVTGIALTKLDVLDGLDEIRICTGYTLHGADARPFPRPRRRPGRGRAGLRDDGGLVRIDRRRAQLAPAPGPGDQIYPPHRGADRLPGRPGLDQPRARGHDPGARSLHRLKGRPRLEAGRRGFIALRHLDPLDAGGGRPVAAARDHRLDRLLAAREQHLDAAVAPVADPAVEAERTRIVDAPAAIEDALDAAVDAEAAGLGASLDQLHVAPEADPQLPRAPGLVIGLEDQAVRLAAGAVDQIMALGPGIGMRLDPHRRRRRARGSRPRVMPTRAPEAVR